MPRSMCLYVLLLVGISISQIDAMDAKLSQERQWESSGIVNCTEEAFTCDDGSAEKIKTSYRCDGKEDCLGGSDEQNCTDCRTPFSRKLRDGFLECFPLHDMYYKLEVGRSIIAMIYPHWKSSQPNCSDNELLCPGTPLCLSSNFICDGVSHCLVEPSDERNCKACNNGAKMCKSRGICIPTESLCDGVNDCPDASDEHGCNCSTCSSHGRALCSNGHCVDTKFVCDGVDDCGDGSDEEGCPASINSTIPLSDTVICESKRYLRSEVCSGLIPECDDNDHCPDGCDDRFAFFCPSYSRKIQNSEHYNSRRTIPGRCIPKSKVCDGHHDCDNGEDEQNCFDACKKLTYLLRMNKRRTKCISKENQCDGVIEFANGIDEKKCDKCSAGAIRCDGGCKPATLRCNGEKDCKDGSDEANCSSEECTAGRLDTYSCEATRTCLKRSAACGPHSLCPQPTDRDERFCIGHVRRTKNDSEKWTERKISSSFW